MNIFDGWAIVGHSANEGIETLYNTLSQYGIKPKEFMLYGDIRTFIRANELDESQAMAFHRGTYVGNLEQTKDYIEYHKPNLAYRMTL